MPYRPPLVPFETFVADPPDLPVRRAGDDGPAVVARAEVVETDDHGLTLKSATSDGGSLVVRVEAAGDGVVRVRLAEDPQARSRSARILPLVTAEPRPARVTVDDGVVRLDAGAVVAEIRLDPWHLRFLAPDGRVLLQQDGGTLDISGRRRTLPFGRSGSGGQPVAYHESFVAPGDERFVGFGEKFTPLDKRGQRALMWNFDAFGSESDRAHKCVPFYLSNRGYGVLVDSGLPVEFDVCQSTHSSVQILVPDDVLDYYVLAGPTPTEVLDRFDRLTGRPYLPPKWAFGSWISSGFYPDSQERVLERARRIRERGIPCDVLHLDCYWQVDGRWSDLQWDTEQFPDPAGMMATLAEQGFRVCLWINPYVSADSPLYAEAAEAGYFLTHADGRTYVADVWHGSHAASAIVDFTDPEATDWFTGLLRPLLEQGAAVFKTDFAEGVPADAVAANGMTGVELHNVYALLFNDAVSEVTREVAGHDTVWARSSFLGGQRHAAQWSGDVNATWPALASTMRGGLSHGLSGIPFWSHDTGGFHGTPEPDLYVRWTQFGAFSPLVRLHGTTSRLPWDFPAETERHAVAALRLRYRFLPYLYSAAAEAARTGAPMMRALLVDTPDDPTAWTRDLEYRLGRDLLVAPMYDPTGRRTVYLPDGDRWVDAHTGEVHTGGRHLRVDVPLERTPLFVRHGALLPVGPPADRIADGPFTDVTLVSWGGVDGRTVVHDSDGDTVVTAVRDGDTLRVTTDGPLRLRGVALAPVAGADAPTRVLLDDVEVPAAPLDGLFDAGA
ncbi:alpha-xylosidase [Micromonospora echinospora]|uniref:Alpha-D-xyloside xylohydrolase n=1 Tax=Micromonospora echinospora TaxID=1877 RepID=A0A1C4ZVM6_MICEC|nr:TIM-barrel domain-containing protein [Micromonospora echinospora]OZV73772.1 alpha-xylosidase [Micromonospora echinospora]SCF36999.1 alpha-D-xyloside xylohydrolase [Micromonospora echinospora]